ncbi:PREDICTED: uncharacterized protein LOC109592492 [Amphimedon queenslandica]|uniref:Death domain-containing protein n=2 Tax=Amphimedon queenslandica TaxID=400682 RepID=A0AAN0K2C8_AMPQE|nr:PREDICTED: uncharacterized protein LOC109592492 [Amphimedon queenslandica]|eukprot:XP_019863488.1 PREDICTED: uncharacterized protein LOC109592492 [Amphimedon queenslandica]
MQCELLSKGSEARMNENKLLKFEEISSIITNKYDFDAFKKALNIDDSKLLISRKDDDSRKKAMMWMLLLWEGQTENPTKYSLISTLRENGYESIAVKIESLDSQKNDQEIVDKEKYLCEQNQFSNETDKVKELKGIIESLRHDNQSLQEALRETKSLSVSTAAALMEKDEIIQKLEAQLQETEKQLVPVTKIPVYGAEVIELEYQDIKEEQIYLGQA